MTKDLRINIAVKNNRLLTLIEEKFGTQAEFTRATGVNQNILSALVTMRVLPTSKNGWRPIAENISAALGVYPSDIWPEHMREVKLITRTASISLDVDEALSITSGSSPDPQMLADLVAKGRETLNKRESLFLDWLLKYGSNATLDEKGAVLNVTRERVRQIEAKIHRKMKSCLYRQHSIEKLN